MQKINLGELQEKTLKTIELQGSLLEKKLKLKETGIKSKTFHYWKMKGLLSTVSGGAWAEISFIEYLWLHVLESMRKFGCSLKLMQKIHHDLFVKAYEENLGKRTIEENVAYFNRLSKKRSLTIEEKQRLRLSEETLKDPYLLYVLKTDVSYFYQSILECINHNRETGIVIYTDDSYRMLGGDDEEINLNKPHIYIPFSYFIAELFADEDKVEFMEQLKLYDEDELRLIKELRNRNVEKVTITFDKSDRRVSKIEYDHSGLIEGEKAKEVMRILGLRNYSGIKLSTRNGTTLAFTKTEKRFIP